MSRISEAFARARQERRIAFIPYLTAGDPSIEATVDLARVLRGCGADLIELGVPFSDPLADGEVIQRAAARSLARGTTLESVLDAAARIRQASDVPLLLFSYLNPLLRMGWSRFAQTAAAAGIDGVLATDLPVEEADDYVTALGERNLDPVFMAAPTTAEDRLDAIGRASRGFLYYVTRAGVTGERSTLPPETAGRVRRLRQSTSLPIALGFGVSDREQVRQAAEFADGVVVGSALVRVVEQCAEPADLAERLKRRVAELF
jgi:tryptophan synthase alpha chain